MKHLRKTFCLFLIFFELCFVGNAFASSASWDRIYDFWITYACYDTSVVQSTLNSYAAPFDGVYRISTLNDNLYVANVGYTQRPPIGSCLIATDLSGWYNIETSFCGCGGGSESGCCCLSALMHQNVSWDDLNYTLGIESVSSVAKRFYLQSSDLAIKNITGTVAAYIQKEDGSWMFLKNLQYLFSPGEEGIDFKCNSYKFEYVLDETPCGPQTYTLIKIKEKLFNARLDQPTFYQLASSVAHPSMMVTENAVNGLSGDVYYASIYRSDWADRGYVGTYNGSFSVTIPFDEPEGSTYFAIIYNTSWRSDNIQYPVTLSVISSHSILPNWYEFYIDFDLSEFIGSWGPEDVYLDKFLSEVSLGSTLSGFVYYGNDFVEWVEPASIYALDEIVCSPTVTQSYYYNKASCAYTEVAPVLESDGTHSFYPGEMCAGSPGVEVWYQTCSGAVKYLYLPGEYKTDCIVTTHKGLGVDYKHRGFDSKQKSWGHKGIRGYERVF